MSICKRSSVVALVVGAAVAASALAGCKEKASGTLATLASAAGPVEKSPQGDAWRTAALGATFIDGDALRTSAGAAKLAMRGGAQLTVQPHTVLRFGNQQKLLDVELGAIEISGESTFDLALGRLDIAKGGAVRISASDAGARFDLLLGAVSVTSGGQLVALKEGEPLSLTLGELNIRSVDAAPASLVPDAAMPDAAPNLLLGEVTLTVVGDGAQVLLPGAKTWQPLAAGPATLAIGAALKTDAKTTATVTAGPVTGELATSSRVTIGDQRLLDLQAGTLLATVPPNTTGQINVPGGTATLQGGANGAVGKFVATGANTSVAAVKGSLAVSTKQGGELDMNAGDSASVSKGGELKVVAQVPTYFDFVVAVGTSAVIHDPKGSTAVKVDFASKCAKGSVLLDRDPKFRAPRVSDGDGAANHMVAGGWFYRVKCSDGKVAGGGRITVIRDNGERRLAANAPTNPIEADGRRYSISYQSLAPNLQVKWRGAQGSGYTFNLASGGKAQTFDGANGIVVVPGKSLKEGTYTYWFEKPGSKSKVSTLSVEFDQAAAQVYIEAPANGKPFSDPVEVKGAALEGWTASTLEGVSFKVDRQRRFSAMLPKPANNVMTIRFTHPQQGVHYYLRRGK